MDNEVKIHNHTISIKYTFRDLLTILKSDDMETFIQKYKLDNLVSKFKYCRRCGPDILPCILAYNCDKIARYVMQTHPPKFNDYTMVIQKMTRHKLKSKQDGYISLFIEMFPQNLADEHIQLLIEKMVRYKLWVILDYVHHMGYRATDINKLVQFMDISRIDYYKKFYDKFDITDDNILILITNNDLQLYTIDKERIVQTINNPTNKDTLITSSIKHGLRYLMMLEDFGFNVDNDMLDIVAKDNRIDLVDYLVDKGYELRLDHIYHLIFMPEENVKKSKPKTNSQKGAKKRAKGRRNYSRWRIESLKKKRAKRVVANVNNYDQILAKLVEKFLEDASIQFRKVLQKSSIYLLQLYCFETLDLFINKYEYVTNFDSRLINDIVWRLINKDDIDNLKRLYKLGVVREVDISKNPSNFDNAFCNKSTKMIDYFSNELNMRCTNNTTRGLYRYENKVDAIKKLQQVGYPFNTPMGREAINQIIKSGSLNGLKYLSELGCKFDNHMIVLALSENKIVVANYLLNNGCSVTKRNLLDRVLNKTYQSYWGYYKKELNQKTISYISKIGGTATIKSVDILCKKFKFKNVPFIYKTFNITPIFDPAIFNFDRWYYRSDDVMKTFMVLLKYYEKCGIEVFKKEYNFFFCALVDKLLYVSDIEDVKYLISKIEYKIDARILYKMTEYDLNDKHLDTVKFIESCGVEITKDMMLRMCRYRSEASEKIIKYIIDKYKFKITRSDIHTMILDGTYLYEILNAVETFKLKLSPYTLQLYKIFHGIRKWDMRDINKMVVDIGTITPELYDACKAVDNGFSRFIKNNSITVEEYEPCDDELVDNDMVVAHMVANQNDENDEMDDDLDDLDDMDIGL